MGSELVKMTEHATVLLDLNNLDAASDATSCLRHAERTVDVHVPSSMAQSVELWEVHAISKHSSAIAHDLTSPLRF
jgi:hypothetical protein